MRYIDLSGMRFGRLTVLNRSNNIGRKVAFRCKCDCGNYVDVISESLKNGHTKSCGCYGREMSSSALKKFYKENPNFYRESATKHGKCFSRLYRIWCNLKSRCNCESVREYPRYGGRGIKYCKDWENFELFYDWAMSTGYNDSLSIDRINLDGDYEPSNCRWADTYTQAWNKSDSIFYTIDGETKCLGEWCSIYNIRYQTAYKRIKSGWSPEDAIKRPVRKSPKANIDIKERDAS